MFIELLQSLPPMQAGVIHDVPADVGKTMIGAGMAKLADYAPAWLQDFLRERLECGAGKPCVFFPFVGEFGHLILSHMRIVHFHGASRKVVCCRRGEEVLFPSADEIFADWIDPLPDSEKLGTIRDCKMDWPAIRERFPDCVPVFAGGMAFNQELWPIHLDRPISLRPKRRGLRADVVLGTRERTVGPGRNWGRANWRYLAHGLQKAGYTYAVAGRRPTSFDVAGQVLHTDDYDTDASIELCQNCKLYIGTDSGMSHLAATVQTPMLIFRHSEYHGRDFMARMEAVNSNYQSLDCSAWGNPDEVLAAALKRLTQEN